ncbi:hypothetical protein SAY87_016153 [Trapa incisa]|uniref:RHD domain-containing protein n=1 Tax=Trapa incisa TaxID=236973 RepID=A0AAN7QV78_9MYRT|nr:hypothetical protein SAY87_016153 [Trapa incisa]
MPPTTMDFKGLFSSSHPHGDSSSPRERQVGFWKSETMPDKNGTMGGKFTSSTLWSSKFISTGSPIKTSMHDPEAFIDQERKLNTTLGISDWPDKASNGPLASSRSLGLDQMWNFNVSPTEHLTESNGINMMDTHCENSLFSCSLSELFSQKINLTSIDSLYGDSTGTVASHYEEEEQIGSMDDIEAHMIVNLLPDDEELFSGVTDGLEFILPPEGVKEMEDPDLFNSVGGMDLEEDRSSDGQKRFRYTGAVGSSGNPYGESANGISSSVPNSLPSSMKVGLIGSQPGLTESCYSMGHSEDIHPHSPSNYHDTLTNGIHCHLPSTMLSSNSQSMDRTNIRQLNTAVSNGDSLEHNEGAKASGVLPGQSPWGCNSYQLQSSSVKWSNSPSFVNGIHNAHSQKKLSGISSRVPSQMRVGPHHVGSAPAADNYMRDHSQHFVGNFPETLSFHHPSSLGNMLVPNHSLQSMDIAPQKMFSHLRRNSLDIPIAPKNVGFQSHNQRGIMSPGRGQMVPSPNIFEAPERIRSRRNEGASSSPDNKKQYELNIDCIIRGEDNRTTLMIKNIPNKYTSKMLLAAIDDHHPGTYDFIYLPIDFKNKCNVGYAFINMIEPSLIVPFYKTFDGKKWEKFNSEKVTSLAYARIQGKAALVAHFQNSSLMNEDKRCRPILFSTEGPNAGGQVPFPVGVNVRSRPWKSRSSSITEDKNKGIQSRLSNREDPFYGEAFAFCSQNSK